MTRDFHLFRRQIRFMQVVAWARDALCAVVMGLIGAFAIATVLNLWGV